MVRLRFVILLVCTTWPGCGVGVYDHYAPLTVLDNFRVITPGQAYRSAQLDADSLALVLERYGIRTVINLRGEQDDEPWYQAERSVIENAGAALVDIPMSASALPPTESLLKLYDTFLAADYPILIHCQGGADRTGAAAALWRMVVRGDSRADASTELSPLYGHFEPVHPAMDELVAIFQPDRGWIEDEYPNLIG